MIYFKAIDVELPDIDKTKLSAWVNQTILDEKQKAGQVFFLFTSDEFLYGMNKRFLDHDYLTDIITFNNSLMNGLISGELYISIDRVKDNATVNQLDFYIELYRVMIHGILHLMGYNDKNQSEQKIMREKENNYLGLLDLKTRKTAR